jgi:hypothetical protein
VKRLALIAIALVLAPAAAAAARPTLAVRSTAPLTLSGFRFESRESVRIVVTAAGTRRVKTVIATTAGTFRAHFTLTVATRCKVFATATGSKGSKAVLRPTQELCGIDIQPVDG